MWWSYFLCGPTAWMQNQQSVKKPQAFKAAPNIFPKTWCIHFSTFVKPASPVGRFDESQKRKLFLFRKTGHLVFSQTDGSHN